MRRIEIDMIEFSGIAFRQVDNRVMSLRLVQLGLSNAAMFSASGEVLQPSEVLYKKPILVERGSFRPVTHVNVDMLARAHEKFCRSPTWKEEPILTLMEITDAEPAGCRRADQRQIDLRDFLARADVLAACGKTVLISNYFEYYRLAAYLARYTKKKIGITMGAASLVRAFRREVLHGPGWRHPRIVRPPLQERSEALHLSAPGPQTGELTTVAESAVAPELRKLYEYLVEQRRHRAVGQLQSGLSADFLPRRDPADQDWRYLAGATMCRREVAEVIRRRGFFGYRWPATAPPAAS